jgi:hypothetical protein
MWGTWTSGFGVRRRLRRNARGLAAPQISLDLSFEDITLDAICEDA